MFSAFDAKEFFVRSNEQGFCIIHFFGFCLVWFGWCLKSFACAGIVPHSEVLDLGWDVAGEIVVVLAKVGELSLPVVAPDAEACGVEFGVEPCGYQGGECGCFGFWFCVCGFDFVGVGDFHCVVWFGWFGLVFCGGESGGEIIVNDHAPWRGRE